MGVLIDSCVIIDLERRKEAVQAAISGREDEPFFISVITASELLHGVHRAKSSALRAKRLAFVESIFNQFPVLEIDMTVSRIHVEIWSGLVKKGKMIGLHDSWIAATCIAHGLSLVTDNTKEFKRIKGLICEKW